MHTGWHILRVGLYKRCLPSYNYSYDKLKKKKKYSETFLTCYHGIVVSYSLFGFEDDDSFY